MHSQRLRQLCILSLCGILLFAQWGCAFDAAQPTQDPTQLASLGFLEEVQKQSGTVEVLSAPFPPQAKLEMPPGGVLGGFRRGAKVGAAFGGWPGAGSMEEGSGVPPWEGIPLYAAGAIVGALLGGLTEQWSRHHRRMSRKLKKLSRRPLLHFNSKKRSEIMW